jgi:hypothetical protein
VVLFVDYFIKRFRLFYHTPKVFFNSFDAYAPHVEDGTPTMSTDYMATVSCARRTYAVAKERFPCARHFSLWVCPELIRLVDPVTTPDAINLPFTTDGFKVTESFAPRYHAGLFLTKDTIPDDDLFLTFTDATFRTKALPVCLKTVNIARPHANDGMVVNTRPPKMVKHGATLGFANESDEIVEVPEVEGYSTFIRDC